MSTPDELFPLYVMDTLQSYPGFPGLFLAGVFSAGLRYVSVLNDQQIKSSLNRAKVRTKFN